jgi:hypothetical protein
VAIRRRLIEGRGGGQRAEGRRQKFLGFNLRDGLGDDLECGKLNVTKNDHKILDKLNVNLLFPSASFPSALCLPLLRNLSKSKS